MARLYFVDVNGRNSYVEIGPDQQEILIGRSSECQVETKHPTVSRWHCKVVWQDGEYRNVDLGSSAGTFYSGERVEECSISDGDTFSCGDFKLDLLFNQEDQESRIARIVRGETAQRTAIETPSKSTEPEPGKKASSALTRPSELPAVNKAQQLNQKLKTSARALFTYSQKYQEFLLNGGIIDEDEREKLQDLAGDLNLSFKAVRQVEKNIRVNPKVQTKLELLRKISPPPKVLSLDGCPSLESGPG